MSVDEATLTYDALAAHSGPKLITDIPGPRVAGQDRPGREGDIALAAARLPLRAQARRGVDRRGRRRQPVPGHQRGHRGDVDRALPSARRGGDPEAGRRAAALLGERLLSADLLRRRRAPRGGGALRRRAGARVPVELGHRGGRGRDQARAVLDQAPVPDRVLSVVPRALDGLGDADRIEVEVPPALRPDVAGRLPLLLRRLRLHRTGAVPARRRARRGRRDRRGIVAGRGWVRVAPGGLVPVPAGALRPPRHPAGLRRGAVGGRAQRHDVGDRTGRRRRPTSSPPARASRAACRSAP